mmetsp:Transcript_12420/g.18564  ORF Transcript_12420/g.18564 Transcript_12420/m.18564 type:complete len:292 (-) Transcript_12420:93-968(-)
MRGKRPRIGADDNDVDEDEHGIISRPATSPPDALSNREKLSKVCDILGIEDRRFLVLPNDGFTAESMDAEARARQRGTKIVRVLTAAICDTVSPSNAKFKAEMMEEPKNYNGDFTRMLANAGKLIFFGMRSVRVIVKSLLATSFRRLALKDILKIESEKYNEDDHVSSMVQKKAVIGSEQYSSLRKVFGVLQNGHDIPKHTYTHRVDATKLGTAVLFIQQSLCLKAGAVRDVSIAGHTFRDMPVYERGGKSIESLLEAYRVAFAEDERVGAHTFAEITRRLTKRGESKCKM